MKVIAPHTVDLKSTNVTANSEAEWSDATTYALGDLVQVTSAFPHTVYKSLRANNINRPPASNLTPAVETGTSTTSILIEAGTKVFTTQLNLGFAAGMIVEISKTTTPSSYNMTGEVSSYVAATGALTVIVSSVTGDGTHAEWTIKSKDEIGFWEEVGATNQHKMFDGYANTQTVFPDEIYVKLNISRADYVAIFNVSGVKVEFFLWDTTETTLLWSAVVDMVYGSSIIARISDWFEYFFGEFSLKEDAGMAMGAIIFEGVLGIKITAASGEDAKCGGVIHGRAFTIGTTRYGSTAGMQDFSQKTTDDAGRTTMTQGYWAKRNTHQVVVQNGYIDMVYKILTSLRGTPTAWIGNNSGSAYETQVVYGVCVNFSIVFSGPVRSGCDLEIEGLI